MSLCLFVSAVIVKHCVPAFNVEDGALYNSPLLLLVKPYSCCVTRCVPRWGTQCSLAWSVHCCVPAGSAVWEESGDSTAGRRTHIQHLLLHAGRSGCSAEVLGAQQSSASCLIAPVLHTAGPRFDPGLILYFVLCSGWGNGEESVVP